VFLYNLIKGLFDSLAVRMDYKHSQLLFSHSKKEMELDIYIPSEKLAFEYFGQQHYMFHHLVGSPEDQKGRDMEKRMACEKADITLIVIPFWWDFKKSSLLATIRHKRPDIFQKYFPNEETGVPIPDMMPTRLQNRSEIKQ